MHSFSKLFSVLIFVILIFSGCVSDEQKAPLKFSEELLTRDPNQIDYRMLSSQGPEDSFSENLKFTVRKESQKAVLYKKNENDKEEKAGLEVRYDWDTTAFPVEVVIAVSPGGTKAAFNKWNQERLKMEIYVAAVNGSDVHKIAEQEVGEGNGALNPNSLSWTVDDDRFVNFMETALICDESFRQLNDCQNLKYRYQVDIENGTKQLLSTEAVE